MQALRRGPFHLIRESFLLAFKNFGHLPVGDPFRVELAELTVLAAGVVLESRRIEEGWVETMGILSFPADSYLEMTDKTESMDYIMEKRGHDPFPQTVRSKKHSNFVTGLLWAGSRERRGDFSPCFPVNGNISTFVPGLLPHRTGRVAAMPKEEEK